MGKGIFMRKLSMVECPSNLVAHSPIAVDGNMVQRIQSFGLQHSVSHSPLASHAFVSRTRQIPDFRADLVWVMQDTFADAVASIGGFEGSGCHT